MSDPCAYGADGWKVCLVCGTRREPAGIIPVKVVLQVEGAADRVLQEGHACNDGWCERAKKIDQLLLTAEQLRLAKEGT